MSYKAYMQINSIAVRRGVKQHLTTDNADPYVTMMNSAGTTLYKTNRIDDVVEDMFNFTPFSGTGERFAVNFNSPDDKFQFVVKDSDWGRDDMIGKSNWIKMEILISGSSLDVQRGNDTMKQFWTPNVFWKGFK